MEERYPLDPTSEDLIVSFSLLFFVPIYYCKYCTTQNKKSRSKFNFRLWIDFQLEQVVEGGLDIF